MGSVRRVSPSCVYVSSQLDEVCSFTGKWLQVVVLGPDDAIPAHSGRRAGGGGGLSPARRSTRAARKGGDTLSVRVSSTDKIEDVRLLVSVLPTQHSQRTRAPLTHTHARILLPPSSDRSLCA